jgi:hypothetical protein
MKKIFVLSLLAAFGMICSCQKQDSTADEQLAQRKLQLDAREEALAEGKSVLDERKKALDEREKVLQQREKSLAAKGQGTMNAQANPANVQAPTQMGAESDSETRQLSTSVPDISQATEKADKEDEIQGAQQLPAAGELQSQKPRSADELDRERQRIMNAAGISPVPQ